MPSELTLLVRLIWIVSLMLALLSAIDTNYRWWPVYIGATLLFSSLYWPEIPGWYDYFWPVVLVITILRTMAAMELLHYQTRDVYLWSRMMAGVFILAFAGTDLVWELRGGTLRDVVIQLGRYLQVWTALMCLLTMGVMWIIGEWHDRPEGRAALAAGAMCIAHGVTSAAFLVGPHDLQWHVWDIVATLIDATAYFAWAIAGAPLGHTIAYPCRQRVRKAH